MLGQERPSPGRAVRVRIIKDWARQALGLAEDAVVLVAELQCTEPGCPPLETVVAIMGSSGGGQQLKVHKQITDVTYEDIKAGAEGMVRGEPHAHGSGQAIGDAKGPSKP